MTKHPDGIVPADMPRDLGRVYAALNGPTDSPSEALLERILRTRASGARMILHVDQVRPRSLRTRLRRGSIAAVLAFAAIAGWSIISRRDRPASSLATRTTGAAVLGSGFARWAEAQSAGRPRYSPLTLVPSRVHAASLAYVTRWYRNGKLEGIDTVGNRIESVGDPVSVWRLSTESRLTDPATVRHPVTVVVSDTLLLDPVRLRPVGYWGWRRYSDGGWGLDRFEFGDTTVRTHFELHDMRYRPIPSGKEATGDLNQLTQDTVSLVAPSRYPRYIGAAGNLLVIFMAAKLTSGLRASMSRLGQSTSWVKSGWADFPLDLVVDGEDQIDAPTGKVDCWKLRAGGVATVTYWLRKSDGVLIRKTVEQKMDDGRMRLETNLMWEH